MFGDWLCFQYKHCFVNLVTAQQKRCCANYVDSCFIIGAVMFPFCLQTLFGYFHCIGILTLSLTQLTKFWLIIVSYYIYIYIYIQCPPLILAPLINMSKGGCENKSALFILLIFHSINSQNSNLSLK